MTKVEDRWKWSRVEAMADGTLTRDERRRMRNAMGADPRLRLAVDNAVALRRELGRLAGVPVPRSLQGRLLGVANGLREGTVRPASRSLWRAGLAAAAAAVAAVAFVVLRPASAPAPAPVAGRVESRDEAVEQFGIAMAYLRRSATIASTETAAAVVGGLHDALSASRETNREARQEHRKNGG